MLIVPVPVPVPGRRYNRGVNIQDRNILVTGGASGLGGAAVDMIVAAGGRAVVVDINEQAGAQKVAAHRDRVRFVRADVTSEADVQNAVQTAVGDFGRLDGVVNAAGIPAAERVLGR